MPKNDPRDSALFKSKLKHFQKTGHHPCMTLRKAISGKGGFSIGCIECGLTPDNSLITDTQLRAIYKKPPENLLPYRVWRELQKALLEPAIEPKKRTRFERMLG
jgi:hypothetical protein